MRFDAENKIAEFGSFAAIVQWFFIDRGYYRIQSLDVLSK
jgi:hypothetical protein